MKTLRNDFPMLNSKINGHPLVYLDSAATTQKPHIVLDVLNDFYAHKYATIGRGVYPLAEQATQLYEDARKAIASWFNAQAHELIFTSGSTHGMNLIAHAWGLIHLKAGDEVVLTELEHHSTLLPWQQVAQQQGATLRYIPVLANGTLDFSSLDSVITSKAKIIIFSHVSNVFGSTADVARIVSAARKMGALVVLDAAQSAPHQRIDVKSLDVDFMVCSGHKMLGPTGIGLLYMHERVHEHVPAYHVGGGMVYEASYTSATWRKLPEKYEAGTPPIAQAIGLHAAIEYLKNKVDFAALQMHEAALCVQVITELQKNSRIRVLGPLDELSKQGHLISFTVEGMHPHDLADGLGTLGICVRAGNLCAQPLAKKLGIESMVRVSFYLYNTQEDVSAFVQGLSSLLAERA